MSTTSLRLQRAYDSLVGLSVGDAFGEQFFSLLAHVELPAEQRVLSRPPWEWTDDTNMALSIYAVSIAHANDLAHRDQLVSLSSGLLMVWAFGSMMGPVVGAGVMEVFGPSGLFGYAGAMYALLTAFIVWRMTARRGVPSDRQIFVDVPTTTPMAAKLAHAEPPDAPVERAQPPK